MEFNSRFLLYIASLVLLAATFSSAQEKIRTVEKGQKYPNSPIEVVGWDLGAIPVTDETKASAGEDWLKKLTLTVRNISNKSIKSFDIDLLVKDRGQVVMGIPIYFRTYTKPTEVNALTLEGGKKLGALQPGEVVRIKVNDPTMLAFDKELEKRGLEGVDRVTLDLRGIYFQDGSRWMFGQESELKRP